MNATDKGLLALAAKAAGHEFHFSREWHEVGAPQIKSSKRWIDWNPLTDDGDALRLAVAIGLSVYPMARTETGQACSAAGNNSLGRLSEVTAQSDIAATRRAIVRAAAEIGRNMK